MAQLEACMTYVGTQHESQRSSKNLESCPDSLQIRGASFCRPRGRKAPSSGVTHTTCAKKPRGGALLGPHLLHDAGASPLFERPKTAFSTDRNTFQPAHGFTFSVSRLV